MRIPAEGKVIFAMRVKSLKRTDTEPTSKIYNFELVKKIFEKI